MPKAKSAESLLDLCLQSVCKLIWDCTREDQVKMASTVNDVVEEENESAVKCVANPFEALDSTLLEQVIDTLWSGVRNIKQLNLLTTKQTRKLDLTYVYLKDKREIHHVLQLAASLCLQYLEFTEMLSQTKYPLEYYHEFLPQFKHLQVLKVRWSSENFDDSCLHLLGIYCIDLRELDISYCNVTDYGIEQLCGGTTVHQEFKRLSHGQCKAVQSLSIDGTKITFRGIQMALLHLPELKILKSSIMIEALSATHQNELICDKYALIHLDLKDQYDETSGYLYKNGDLQLAASRCPLVTHIDIEIQEEVTDSDLLGLAVLEGLRYLKLSNFIDLVRITFDGGLAPLLQARGHSLKTLELAFLSKSVPVHLGTVVECCRNLKRLAFRCIYFTPACIEEGRPSKRTKSDFLLNHLEELYLVDAAGRLHRHLIKELLLLSAPTLKKLVFVHCNVLDDDTLREVFQFRSFKYPHSTRTS